jgi:hypothetical protein
MLFAPFLAVCRSSIRAETLGDAASFSSGASRSLRINCNPLHILINEATLVGFVANFAQEVVKEQLPLSAGGLGG